MLRLSQNTLRVPHNMLVIPPKHATSTSNNTEGNTKTRPGYQNEGKKISKMHPNEQTIDIFRPLPLESSPGTLQTLSGTHPPPEPEKARMGTCQPKD